MTVTIKSLQSYLPYIIFILLVGAWFYRNYITGQNLEKALENGEYELVDVRTPAEFASESIPNSINIPLNELTSRLSEISKEKTVIVFCASGGRSSSAKAILEKENFKNIVNGGGIGSVKNSLNSMPLNP